MCSDHEVRNLFENGVFESSVVEEDCEVLLAASFNSSCVGFFDTAALSSAAALIVAIALVA